MILISASVCAYLCTRIGLSPVVGYLVAGLIVGTPEIVFPYVTDEARIAVIAQLGVVFLMFVIGLQFRLQRVKELGLPIVIATATTALLVLTAARLAGDLLGLSGGASLAMAAIFMGSSSAIISKVLQDTGVGHDRHGQLALGITLMEDIVAVVMLAVLGSYLIVGGVEQARAPLQTILVLIGFAVLIFVLGLLFIPRVLAAMSGGGKSEAMTVFIVAMLLLMGLVAVRAGYSLALGAFLCGMIVAETRQKPAVERMFRGLKDIFLTLFFVTIGMMIDITAIPAALKWILLGTFAAIVGRSCAAFASLVLVGEHPRTAMRAALCLTPIGEFSFIIAGFAVAGGLFSENFQVVAVGIALLTSIIFPLLATHGDRLSRFLAEGERPGLERMYVAYSGFWKGLGRAGSGGILWKLLRKRVLQVALELLILSTVLIFANPVFSALSVYVYGAAAPAGAYYVFWLITGVLCLIPLLAIWRNLSAVALILGDYSNRLRGDTGGEHRAVNVALHVFFAVLLFLWMWNMLPGDLPRAYIITGVASVAGLLIPLFWKHMVRWHSEVEWALDQSLRGARRTAGRRLFESWQEAGWDLHIEEVTLPDDTLHHGQRLMDTALRKRSGCSIVGIERHGHVLTHVGPGTHLFAGDELLLLGSRDQVRQAQTLLTRTGSVRDAGQELAKSILESLKVDGPPVAGKTLAELNWPRMYGIQVVAIRRDGETQVALDGSTRIHDGDTLLLLGTLEALGKLADDWAAVAPS